ncbi:MAG: alanine dehydrogenase [Verrucomicrobiales bacterium]|jgi:alanine dehydrogenase
MLHLDNDDIIALMPMSEVMSSLRIGYDQLADRDAAHVPRLELWSPAEKEDGYHCLGSMAGTTKHFGYSAIRIKSDVIHWPEGKRQEKYAVEPGTFCGFILLFATATGEPVALINDGALQRMRVGGTAGVVADALANPDASSVGIIGAGDMARAYLEAISLSRSLRSVKVFSPTAANREAFAVEMSEKIGVPVEAVDTAESAVSDCSIVVTATNSMVATLRPEWLSAGAYVVNVTRRELSTEVVDGVDRVLQLGEYSIGPGANVADMEFPQSGAGAFVAGNENERARLPWRKNVEQRSFPSYIDLLSGKVEGRQSKDETILFVNIGVQGVQFASVAGQAYERALQAGRGKSMNTGQFLQDIRD